MARVRDGQEGEYQDVVREFCEWSERNGLFLNSAKTKELILDFRRTKPPTQPINIRGEDIEVVGVYKYLGVHIDDNLDWTLNTDALLKKGRYRLFFLRGRSFDVCREMLVTFYQSVMSSVLFYAAVCWGGNIKKEDADRINKLVRKASSVVGQTLDPLEAVVERQMRGRTLTIMANTSHPLQPALV